MAALAKMAGTNLIHYGEIGLRALAGAGLWLAAGAVSDSRGFVSAGLFLMATSAALLLIARRWHAKYAGWRARRIPVSAVRPFALVSLGAGAPSCGRCFSPVRLRV